MKPTILLLALLAAPAYAGSPKPAPSPGGSGGGSSSVGSNAATAVAPNQAQNNQSSSGVINQAPVGGINNNTQFNNSASTDYGFGGGIVCRGANLSIGSLANGNSGYGFNSSGFGAVIGLNIPLGGGIGATCAALAGEVLQQRQLDTCLTLLKAGVVADPAVFPDLARCAGLSMAVQPVTPAPAHAPAPVKLAPIRGMW